MLQEDQQMLKLLDRMQVYDNLTWTAVETEDGALRCSYRFQGRQIEFNLSEAKVVKLG